MSEILSATTLYKTYTLPHKTVNVLQGASLSASDGECVAIVGRSGAGKSTLLHLLGGLDKPDQGDVFVEQDNIYALKPRQRSRLQACALGFVFQSYHLLPEMDLVENVMLPSLAIRNTKMTKPRRRQRAEALLDSVGLGDRNTHRPLELSGGEQQRVALARAIMNKPKLILADEPTGNLDTTTGTQVLDLLFQLTRKGGHGMIMVTHNEAVASRCDRILHLDNGLLV